MPKNPALTYEKIKSAYDFWGHEGFRRLYPYLFGSKKKIIRLLADRENDGEYPLAILREINEDLSEALTAWTSGHYEKIRCSQESGDVGSGSLAYKLQSNLNDLPSWKKRATHYSNESLLYDQLYDRREFTLLSCMSCSAPGFKPAEVSMPMSTLVFRELKSARLVGALSTTNCEHEVILPANSNFKVIRVDRSNREIFLEEK